MDNIVFRVSLSRKRMYLSRFLIKALGNPTHLYFWYDEHDGNLFVTAAEKDDLDAYEIQEHFWKNTKHSCEISRISLLLALQYRIGWEKDSLYLYEGIVSESGGKYTAVFNLADGVRLDKET